MPHTNAEQMPRLKLKQCMDTKPRVMPRAKARD